MAVNIDFGLLNGAVPDFGGAAQSYVQQLRLNQDQQLRDYQISRAKRQDARDDRTDRARTTAAGQLAGGDATGAQQTAIGAGDFDLAKTIGSMTKEQREEQAAHASTIGALAFQLKGVPADQRMAQLQAAVPALKARGITDAEINAANLTDEGLNGYIAASTTLHDAINQHNEDRKFDYTQQHDAATMDLTKRGQDITMRGQDRQAADAAAGRQVTMRGQDLTQAGGAYRLMTPDEKQAAGLPSESVYQVNGKNEIVKVGGNTSVRPIPSQALEGITSNRNALRKIDQAIAAVQSYPQGLGGANYLGDFVRQRSDPNGVDVRARIADIGSQKLHDRSGAAVTASEAPRLQPFIPNVTDTKEAALQKLNNLRAEYASTIDDTEAFYSPEAGYMTVPKSRGGNAGQPGTVTGAPKVGTIQGGYRYTGGDPGRKSSWAKN